MVNTLASALITIGKSLLQLVTHIHTQAVFASNHFVVYNIYKYSRCQSYKNFFLVTDAFDSWCSHMEKLFSLV
jgi:hypothetical protein